MGTMPAGGKWRGGVKAGVNLPSQLRPGLNPVVLRGGIGNIYPAINREKTCYSRQDVVLCVAAKEANTVPKIWKDLYYGDLTLFDHPVPGSSPAGKRSTHFTQCETKLAELWNKKGKVQLENPIHTQ